MGAKANLLRRFRLDTEKGDSSGSRTFAAHVSSIRESRGTCVMSVVPRYLSLGIAEPGGRSLERLGAVQAGVGDPLDVALGHAVHVGCDVDHKLPEADGFAR